MNPDPRIPMLPRRFWRHGPRGPMVDQLGNLSPRQRYIMEQSTLRYVRNRRPGHSFTLLRGELGQIDGIRILTDAGLGA